VSTYKPIQPFGRAIRTHSTLTTSELDSAPASVQVPDGADALARCEQIKVILDIFSAAREARNKAKDAYRLATANGAQGTEQTSAQAYAHYFDMQTQFERVADWATTQLDTLNKTRD